MYFPLLKGLAICYNGFSFLHFSLIFKWFCSGEKVHLRLSGAPVHDLQQWLLPARKPSPPKQTAGLSPHRLTNSKTKDLLHSASYPVCLYTQLTTVCFLLPLPRFLKPIPLNVVTIILSISEEYFPHFRNRFGQTNDSVEDFPLLFRLKFEKANDSHRWKPEEWNMQTGRGNFWLCSPWLHHTAMSERIQMLFFLSLPFSPMLLANPSDSEEARDVKAMRGLKIITLLGSRAQFHIP